MSDSSDPKMNPSGAHDVRRSRPPLVVRVGLIGAVAAAGLVLAFATERLRAENASPYPMSTPVSLGAATTVVGSDQDLWSSVPMPVVHQIRRGDTIQGLLERAGLEQPEAAAATRQVLEHIDPRSLRAGAPYTVFVDDSEQTVAVSWAVSDRGRLWLEKGHVDEDSTWNADFRDFVRTSHRFTLDGTLDGALETSIANAGGHPLVAIAMADVLQWDLDFNRDLRSSDKFHVVYTEARLDGRFHQVERVEALVYDNQGRVFEAYHFADDETDGYYDADGRPLRRQFLRSPLPYSRVTSGYSPRRFHPVLKVYRPHYGVDYGAPKGTPVRVTANGVVSWSGWDKGGGKTIKVRHPNGFESAYLHLSKFAQGIAKGKGVRQGDVIGFVGSTGLATGPHLDYRMKRNGRYLDPRTLSRQDQPIEPLAKSKIAAFEARRDELRTLLAVDQDFWQRSDQGISLADNDTSPSLQSVAGEGD